MKLKILMIGLILFWTAIYSFSTNSMIDSKILTDDELLLIECSNRISESNKLITDLRNRISYLENQLVKNQFNAGISAGYPFNVTLNINYFPSNHVGASFSAGYLFENKLPAINAGIMFKF